MKTIPVLLVALVLSSNAFGQLVLLQEAKFTPAEPAPDQHTGNAIAVNGNTMLVPSPNNDAVSVYVRSGVDWPLQAVLKPQNPEPPGLEKFGWSLALEGDTAVVGAYGATIQGGTSTGAVYVFNRTGTTWSQTAKLIASDSRSQTQFGTAVAFLGSRILVGRPLAEVNGLVQAGAAYVFVNQNGQWIEEAKLVASVPEATEDVGVVVALSDDFAVVTGAKNKVHVFRHTDSGWAFHQTLSSSEFSQLGTSLALWNDRLFIGAPGYQVPPTTKGVVFEYIWNGETWMSGQVITARDGSLDSNFGRAVAVDGVRLVVGDPFHGDFDFGIAYVFELINDGWTETVQIHQQTPSNLDGFGYSVSLSGPNLAVGQYSRGQSVSPSAGYAFHQYVPVDACPSDLNGDGVINGADLGLLLSDWGSCDR